MLSAAPPCAPLPRSYLSSLTASLSSLPSLLVARAKRGKGVRYWLLARTEIDSIALSVVESLFFCLMKDPEDFVDNCDEGEDDVEGDVMMHVGAIRACRDVGVHDVVTGKCVGKFLKVIKSDVSEHIDAIKSQDDDDDEDDDDDDDDGNDDDNDDDDYNDGDDDNGGFDDTNDNRALLKIFKAVSRKHKLISKHLELPPMKHYKQVILSQICTTLLSPGNLFAILTSPPSSSLSALLSASLTPMYYDVFVSTSRKVLLDRVLHIGVDTTTIVDVYVNVVAVINAVHPPLLHMSLNTTPRTLSVQEVFGSHLLNRKDTIREIVKSLLNEDEEGIKLKGVRVGEELEDAVTESDGKREVLDLLVSVFGGKEGFVMEYRKLLADKLKDISNFESDEEVRKLELLKLR